MPGLPSPTTNTKHRKTLGLYQLAKSKRVLSLLFTLLVVIAFYIFDVVPLLRSEWGTSHTYQEPIPSRSDLGSLTPIEPVAEELSSEPLTSLGLEADRSFRLGSTSKSIYKAELQQFVNHVFPKWLQDRARASIELYLGDTTSALKYPEVPHRIFQTAKVEPRWEWRTSTWRNVPGYTHQFFDDVRANKWVGEVFNGTEIESVWNIFGPGIKQSDLLRYLLVMVEGGIYTDIDTIKLKDISNWGQGADVKGPETAGPPSAFVGIEADVGTRPDWHKWYPRPAQITQWTFSMAPLHPILIDAVRRVHHITAIAEAHKNGSATAKGAGQNETHWVGGELLRDDGSISIMEWTGPGVFTDSVVRYLASKHQIKWPALKDLRKPVRFGDVMVLPVTGFSPGVGMFGAGETSNPEAMVHHLFAGSWKSGLKNER